MPTDSVIIFKGKVSSHIFIAGVEVEVSKFMVWKENGREKGMTWQDSSLKLMSVPIRKIHKNTLLHIITVL